MESQLQYLFKAFVSVCVAGLLWLFWRLYNLLVNKPEKLRSILRKQGINGPSPILLLGNILEMKKSRSANVVAPPFGPPTHHNCGDALFPFFESWRKDYGMYGWNGYIAVSYIPRLVPVLFNLIISASTWKFIRLRMKLI